MKKLTVRSSFEKNWKSLAKKHYDKNKLGIVVDLLRSETSLPRKYKDHALTGNWQGFRECHIESNWLLIYQANDEELVLVATGSHDDLFKKQACLQ
jgi:mRNA interferase YafQ